MSPSATSALAVVFCCCLLAAYLASPVVADNGANGQPKLRGDLADGLHLVGPAERIPITIVMSEQADRSAVAVSTLKSVAEGQSGLLADLQRRQADGSVGPDLRRLWIRNIVVVEATSSVILELVLRHDVDHINWDRPVALESVAGEPVPPPAAPAGTELQCGLDALGVPEVWSELGLDGEGVVVGVIDSGTCTLHPDLWNAIWSNADEIPGNSIDDDQNGYVDDVHGWNFHDNDNDLDDENGHGTAVAGLVAGNGTQGIQTGVAPGAKIMVLKAVDLNTADNRESDVWAAMQYGLDNGADVLNLSIGWRHNADPDRASWRMITENLMDLGVVTVVAGGNNDSVFWPVDNVVTPADVPEVITLGATGCNELIWEQSSRGPVTWEDVPGYGDWPYPPGKMKPTVSAPGAFDLTSTLFCDGYLTFGGTSGASAQTAGVAALILEAHPGIGHHAVREILIDTALDRGEDDWDNEYGAGFVDAFAAASAEPDIPVPAMGKAGAVLLVLSLLALSLLVWRFE